LTNSTSQTKTRKQNSRKQPLTPSQQQSILTPAQEQEIKEAFNLFDVTRTGRIDSRDAKVAMRAMGFEPNIDDIKIFLQDNDIEEGHLTYPHFRTLMTQKMVRKKSFFCLLHYFSFFVRYTITIYFSIICLS